jgi:hypothetical protein
LFVENVSGSLNVEWDYKTNDTQLWAKHAGAAWTNVATPFSTAPVQEIALNVSAKRIRFRFRLQTNDRTETPIIRGIVVSATTRPETRYTYSMRTIFADQPIDLRGNIDTTVTASSVMTQLDTWMEANTPLTMSSLFTPFHNKTVYLEPVVTNPLTIVTDESKERLEGTLVLVES